MPELPEVETVRRGLQPVMEGSTIVRAEARRRPAVSVQKDFVARLEGQIVTGLGRRAKYLLADLASGDVLLMHLGMSGSFRVTEGEDQKTPGKFTIRETRIARTIMLFFTCRRARPLSSTTAPLRLHEDHCAPCAGGRAAPERPRSRTARQRIRRGDAGALCANKKTSLRRRCSISAWSRGSATSMSARRCFVRICRRGDWPRRWRPKPDHA